MAQTRLVRELGGGFGNHRDFCNSGKETVALTRGTPELSVSRTITTVHPTTKHAMHAADPNRLIVCDGVTATVRCHKGALFIPPAGPVAPGALFLTRPSAAIAAHLSRFFTVGAPIMV